MRSGCIVLENVARLLMCTVHVGLDTSICYTPIEIHLVYGVYDIAWSMSRSSYSSKGFRRSVKGRQSFDISLVTLLNPWFHSLVACS